MDIIILIFTGIGAIATVVSTVIAIRAKNEAKCILEQIKSEENQNAINGGSIDIRNTGSNSGIISGMNTGDVYYEQK